MQDKNTQPNVHPLIFSLSFSLVLLLFLAENQPRPPSRTSRRATFATQESIGVASGANARRRSDVDDDVSDISSRIISWGLWQAALLQAVTAALGTDPCSAPRSPLRTSWRWPTASSRSFGIISRDCPNIWRHRSRTTREYFHGRAAFETDDTTYNTIRTGDTHRSRRERRRSEIKGRR